MSFPIIRPPLFKKLFLPKPLSHKGENGVLTIVAGSLKYHGAPILATKVASKIVDLIYFSSVPQNNELLRKMKLGLCEFITVGRTQLDLYANKSDCILLGPGMEVTENTKRIIHHLLKEFKNKKFVLDANALEMLDLNLLSKNCIVTPHQKEFNQMFKCKANLNSAQKMAEKYKCAIVLKMPKSKKKKKGDIVCFKNQCYYNLTGNAGMTKGGTGDVLAGLIAALACKNEPILAALAGIYLNGLAADRLFKRVSYYYNASDLIEEIPRALRDVLAEVSY